MVSVLGIYENGFIKLEEEYTSSAPVKVRITFLEEIKPSTESSLSLADFSFLQTRAILKNYTGSLTDTLIEERRSGL